MLKVSYNRNTPKTNINNRNINKGVGESYSGKLSVLSLKIFNSFFFFFKNIVLLADGVHILFMEHLAFIS